MQKHKEKRKISLLPIVYIWITSILLLTLFVSSKYNTNENNFKQIEKIYIENLKSKIKIRIDNLSTLLTTTYTNRFEAIEFIDKLRFDDGTYVFVLDENKTMLVHKNKMLTNVPFEMTSDPTYKKNVSNIVSSSLEKTSLFVNYSQSKSVFNRDKELNKISYVKHLPSYNFIIGTGLYDDDIQKELKIIKKDLDEKLEIEIKNLILFSLVIVFAITTILILLAILARQKQQRRTTSS